MKITLNFLESKDTCEGAIEFFKENYKDKIETKDLVLDLINKNKFDYANWLISQVLTLDNCAKYSVFAAELVLPIFEKLYPTDDRHRLAIEAAKNYLKTNAACAACAAACNVAQVAALVAACDDTQVAAKAAALVTAKAAAWVTRAAEYAIKASVEAGDYNDNTIPIKILEFGLKLIVEQDEQKII